MFFREYQSESENSQLDDESDVESVASSVSSSAAELDKIWQEKALADERSFKLKQIVGFLDELNLELVRNIAGDQIKMYKERMINVLDDPECHYSVSIFDDSVYDKPYYCAKYILERLQDDFVKDWTKNFPGHEKQALACAENILHIIGYDELTKIKDLLGELESYIEKQEYGSTVIDQTNYNKKISADEIAKNVTFEEVDSCSVAKVMQNHVAQLLNTTPAIKEKGRNNIIRDRRPSMVDRVSKSHDPLDKLATKVGQISLG